MQTKDILKDLRKSKGYTSMKDFCDIADINFSTYQNYETGKRIPTADILIKLADFYGVTTDYLLGREKNESTDFSFIDMTEEKIFEKYFELSDDARKAVISFLRKSLTEAEQRAEQRKDMQINNNSIIESTTAGELEEKAKAQAQEQDAG